MGDQQPPLGAQLEELYHELRARTRERWSRDLPLYELLFDRWERARSLGFGEGTSIYQSSYVFGDVVVGEGTWIGPYTILDGSGGLRIGSHCSISSGVQIYTHDTVSWAINGGNAPYEHEAVEIGDCCYIGSQSVVTQGVVVGERTVVGACSFVSRTLPPCSVAVGAPARVVGHVEERNGKYEIVLDEQPA
jgi:acetyltransferase-like isoleucine patch superfamily enzyme